MTSVDLRPQLFDDEYELLHREMIGASSYLEFGAGGSTLLAARSGVARIVTGDSDPAWLDRVQHEIAAAHPNAQVEFIRCDIGRTGEWGVPLDRDQIASWPSYFLLPWQRFLARGEIPDLIYVDGRFRVACALYSLLILHLHGRRLFRRKTRIMIHDFTKRPHYGKVADHAAMVTSKNTLAVFEQKRDICQSELVQDLLSFQFDPR